MTTTEKINEALETARGMAWDGCHKIYILMDAGEVRQMQDYGYGEDHSYLVAIEQTDDGRADALRTLEEWWEESCALRFINTVKSPGRNDDFENIISQFEEWED